MSDDEAGPWVATNSSMGRDRRVHYSLACPALQRSGNHRAATAADLDSHEDCQRYECKGDKQYEQDDSLYQAASDADPNAITNG